MALTFPHNDLGIWSLLCPILSAGITGETAYLVYVVLGTEPWVSQTLTKHLTIKLTSPTLWHLLSSK